MDQLVPIIQSEIDGEVQDSINARELWTKLGIGTQFINWTKRRIKKFKLYENKDYIRYKNNKGCEHKVEYILTLDNAKKILLVDAAELFEYKNINGHFAKINKIVFKGDNVIRYLYIIKCLNYVKIGIAENVLKRIETLQMSNPLKLKLLAIIPGDLELETKIHECFKKFRERGEWFRYDNLIKDFCDKVATLNQESLINIKIIVNKMLIK